MKRAIFSAAASVWVLALASMAQAQTAPNTPAPQPASPPAGSTDVEEATPATNDSEIVVTGSRTIRNGEQAPTPSTVIGTAELQAQAITSMVDVSRSLPQFRSQRGAQSGANNSQNGGQGSLDLRNLGANRNLILLNGQRVVPSTGNGIVDVNILPSSLIGRIDVVTGGASAAYGSDAVSGVVNFVLDTRFRGLKVEASTGVSEHGDNAELTGNLAFGTRIGERLHLIGSVEYYRSFGMKMLSRDFLQARGGIINNPAYTRTNGQFRNIVTDGNIVAAYMSTGGLVNGCRSATGANVANCSLAGLAFSPDGSAHRFEYGTYVNPTGNMVVPIGSMNPDYANIYDGVMQTHPSERVAFYGRTEYEVTSSFKVFADAIVSRSQIGPTGNVPPYRFGTSSTTWLSVTADNAYLSPAVKAQMSGPGGGNPAGPYYLNIGRFNYDWGGVTVPININKTQRFTLGTSIDIGGSWKFDAYGAYGKNAYTGTGSNNLLTSESGVTALGKINLATDTIVAAAGNTAGVPAGTIICRSRLTNPNNGCVPINIFGVGNATPAAIAYVMGSNTLETDYQQRYAEASLRGNLFDIWSGPVAVAVGASYRSEKVAAVVDANSAAGNFGISNAQPYSGSERVKEAFGEMSFALFRDFDVNVAGRITDYRLSGRVETWKAGATWQLPGFLSDLKLRASRSRDIRAPSLAELFTGASQSRGSVIDPFKPGNVTVNIQSYTGGNRNLVPERADTLALGVVFKPSFIPGLSGSIDYYNIKIKQAIGTISTQNTVDRCFAGNLALCNQVTRDAQGNIISIFINNLNVAARATDGIDFETTYRHDIGKLFGSENTTAGVRLFVNHVRSFVIDEGAGVQVQLAGSLFHQQPKWTGQAMWFLSGDSYQFTINNRLVGGGNYNNAFEPNDPSYVPNAIQDNGVGMKIYTAINFKQDIPAFGGKAEMFFNINNVFDVKPPYGFAFNYGLTASPMYDVVGRMFKLGVRFRL